MSDTLTATVEEPRKKLTKKAITADHPTWCPGCGDFAVLACYYKVLEKRQIQHEKIVTVAGIGCSSRFPYFVKATAPTSSTAAPFRSPAAISLARPDLHVFVFGGDGDGFSIGGNHLNHTARKNVKMTYVIMDNFVYGLTKKQTSPTSPIGFKSKTDPQGAIDQPINPMKQLIAGGATFVARTHATHVKHMIEMMERAMDHDGFSVIECLSECVEFFPGAFDAANPRKGGAFRIDRRKKIRQHARGRGAARRHRRARRLQAGADPIPRRLRRLLPKRSPDQERAREKVDRLHPRKTRPRQRPRRSAEDF